MAVTALVRPKRAPVIRAFVLLLTACFIAAPAAAPAFADESAPSCNLYASTSGSDSASGSAAAPFRTIGTLMARLHAGQVGCLAAGQTFNESVTLRGESHGVEGSPITLTSADPANPALISGRFTTETGADWLTFTHLRFTYSEHGFPSPTVGSKHTTWTYDDVTAPTTICFNLVNGSYGVAEDTLIEHSRVHGCGSAEKFACNQNSASCEAPPNDGFFLHGIYVAGARQSTIRNNYIYENADRGVQVRAGSNGVVVEHNIIDGNGEGVIFGDGSSHVTVQWNVITDSHSPCGEVAGCYDYAASEYQAVAPNLLAHNDVYGSQCANEKPACWPNRGNVEAMSHVTAERNIEDNPLYVNASSHDYTLQAKSPALGYGPDTAQPEAANETVPVEPPPTEKAPETTPTEKAPESTPPNVPPVITETPGSTSGGSTTPPVTEESKKATGGGGSTPPVHRRRYHRQTRSAHRVLHRVLHKAKASTRAKHH
jgi:parallel beta-helix repeat protein